MRRHARSALALGILAAMTAAASPAPAVPPGTEPAKIYVVDADAGTAGKGALFELNLAGDRSILTDFGFNRKIGGSKQPDGKDPVGVAVLPDQTILVLDSSAGGRGELFTVDPATGDRAVLSDFRDKSQGPRGRVPIGVAVGPGGTIWVLDNRAGTSFSGALFKVDPVSGARALVSDLGDPTQGQTSDEPQAVAVEAAGTILIVGSSVFTFGPGGGLTLPLYRVDPATGDRTVLSELSNPAQGATTQGAPRGLTIEPDGSILVAVEGEGPHPGGVFRVDKVTGARSLLSDFSNPAQGDAVFGFMGLAIGFDLLNQEKILLVVEGDLTLGHRKGLGALLEVDPTTGVRTVLSDFSDPVQGPTGVQLRGVAFVGEVVPPPPPSTTVVVPNADATVRGNIGNTIPWDCSSGSVRYQQVYAGSEVGSGTITRIAVRPRSSVPFVNTHPSVAITLSSTAIAPDALSTTYADNVGADVQTVFSGALTLSSAGDTGFPSDPPAPFDIVIPLQSSFAFDASTGKNLLLDVNILTCGATVGGNFDAQDTLGDSVSRVFTSTPTVVGHDSLGLVTQFSMQ